MPNPQVTFPAYFTPANAVAFANPDSSAQVVSTVTPLPVTVASASGTLAMSATALPLPAGAATAANQATGNTALAAIQAAVTAPTPTGSNLIGQVLPAYFAPTAWASPAAAQDMRAYAAVTVAVTTAPSTAYTPQWSPDGASWFAMAGVDLNFNVLTSIAATFTGAITFKGGGYIRLNGGTGGVFQISGGQ